MNFFARMSPLRAVRDLRFFLAQREPYELWFLLLAIVLTTLLLVGFVHDSHVPREYKRDIVYVQQWRADRPIEEIRRQNLIDQAKKDVALADQKKRQAATQAEFKKLDDKLTGMGL